MLNQFKEFVKTKELFKSSDKLLLAVSGGVDSMVLMNLIERLGIDFEVAHCNYNLRGKDSILDEKLVRTTVKKNEKKLHVLQVDIVKERKKRKGSLQQVARDIRYEWLSNIAGKNNCKYILTAHHAGDNTETILLNLIKGSGAKGLAGIPIRRENIIRPLLFATKEELLRYAMKNKINFREDSSNYTDKYTRNKIRNKIVPLLKKINPSLESTLLRNAEIFRLTQSLVDEQVSVFKKKYFVVNESGIAVDISELKKLKYAELVLFELLKHFGFSFDAVTSIVQCIRQNQSGKVIATGNFTATLNRSELIVVDRGIQVEAVDLKVKKNQNEFVVGGRNVVIAKQKLNSNLKFNKSADSAYVDYDKLNFPLRVRSWKSGDRFQPFGMKGFKKISDLLVDLKVPVSDKKKVVVMLSGNDIVWVLGIRSDNRYKVTKQTKSVLILKIK